MLSTVEAIVDENGQITLLEPFPLRAYQRVLITILKDDDLSDSVQEVTLLSEPALAEDWNRPEEDQAWKHLQSDQ